MTENTNRCVGSFTPRAEDRIQPVTGWPLEIIGPLEQARPGLLWRLMGRGPQWRHSLFAWLASRPAGASGADAVEAASEWGADLLAQRAHGSPVPDGLMGAYGKLGLQACPPEFYPNLHRLLSAGDLDSRLRARALRQLPILTAGMLDAILTLEPPLCSPTIVSRYSTREAAERLNTQARAVMMSCNGETWETIREAVEAEERHGWPGWAATKLRRADRPFPLNLPTDVLSGVRRVTPRGLQAIGAEFRNCLAGHGDYRARLLCGRFALIALREPKVLVELVLLDHEGWTATAVHLPSNHEPSRQVQLEVRSVLEGAGVKLLVAAPLQPELADLQETLKGWRNPVLDLQEID